jgi:hypothetical protein
VLIAWDHSFRRDRCRFNGFLDGDIEQRADADLGGRLLARDALLEGDHRGGDPRRRAAS